MAWSHLTATSLPSHGEEGSLTRGFPAPEDCYRQDDIPTCMAHCRKDDRAEGREPQSSQTTSKSSSTSTAEQHCAICAGVRNHDDKKRDEQNPEQQLESLGSLITTEEPTWQRRKTGKGFNFMVQVGSQLPATGLIQLLFFSLWKREEKNIF